MAFTLSGCWENSYGSMMHLNVQHNGSIHGAYSSSTGSSGNYLLLGNCRPDNPSKEKGQGLTLSIFWRSTTSESPDESWHWVSTYCGQLQHDGTLSVINSLVATTTFNGITTGDYIDKLVFTKTAQTDSPPSLPDTLLNLSSVTEAISNPINGTWQDPSSETRLSLSVVDKALGLIKGSLIKDDQHISVCGFTDTHLGHQTELQSISLSGYLADNKQPISLSGQLNIQTKQLQLSCWLANSTTPNESYLQANVAHWVYSKIA